MNHKVLIVAPEITIPGGVANYYASIKPFLPASVSLFAIGKRNNEGKSGFFSRFMADYNEFKKTVNAGDYSLVMVNPSLNPKALLRDMLLVNYARKKGIKVITFFRGWSVEMAKKLGTQRFWIAPFLRSDAIITLSKDSQNVLENLGYKKTIYLETTTVADDLLKGLSTSPKEITDDFTILFMSRIEKEKGIIEAIDTLKLLNVKYPKVNLVVAGDGGALPAAKEYVATNNIPNVTFTGYVRGDDKAKLLNEASIYFFPSYHNEGMPNSVLESMAFGLPIVTRDIGGVKDFFIADKMGAITLTKQPEEFAPLIEALITSPEKQKTMGEFNKKFAAENFLSSVVVARLNKIFNEVIGK